MDKLSNNFTIIIPADLEKSKDGDWKLKGLASTEQLDQQGEIILQKGIDLTPIDKKRGIINWDHKAGPENTIGLLDGYSKSDKGLYVEGRLFKNHTKAKAVYEIMNSLNKGDSGRVGLSVEGKILERDSQNPKIIKKCIINAVAVTMNPVNSSTYADIIKSMSSAESLEFESIEDSSKETQPQEASFTATQVLAIVQKALSISSDIASKAPNEKSGGDALTQENLDKDIEKKKKKLKRLESPMSKSLMLDMLDKLSVLYPESSRSEIWNSIKDRLDTKFPHLELKKLNVSKE